jgi:ribosomal protein L40E
LSPYFDFCVNSETVGVGKPDKRVYAAAIKLVAAHPLMENDFHGQALRRGLSASSNEVAQVVEEVVGPWWIHIGDDFIKDIVAAKELKMRTIWCRELVKPKDDMVAAPNSNNEQGGQKQRSVEDLVKEMSNMEVVEMSIGAEDFLLDSMEREFADAVIDEFHHLGTVMAEWHADGVKVKQSPAAPEPAKDIDISSLGLELVFPDDVQASIPTADTPTARVPETTVTESSSPETPETKADTKFCVFCGAKIPAVAKFCSSCGEKQL